MLSNIDKVVGPNITDKGIVLYSLIWVMCNCAWPPPLLEGRARSFFRLLSLRLYFTLGYFSLLLVYSNFWSLVPKASPLFVPDPTNMVQPDLLIPIPWSEIPEPRAVIPDPTYLVTTLFCALIFKISERSANLSYITGSSNFWFIFHSSKGAL